MSLEENKRIARRFFKEVWVDGNLTSIDELAAPTITVFYPDMEKPTQGPEALKQHLLAFRAQVTNQTYEGEDDIIAEGDKVAVRWTWRATYTNKAAQHLGLVPTAITGKQGVWSGISIFHIVDGKVVEERGMVDILARIQQLDLIADWTVKTVLPASDVL